ncbi:flagellar filament capping protein FliD [Paenibacillus sp. OV219]|uniref:flagellar filament capping protein FliD n=1 Tax=Paenibacillus sp. OV219 TaxID=1884377 RepID=UPI0008B52A23|nr:flagellar filament capping protein FliD [Paenibacillus sp. OV219]SEN64933.1 flagellar hook-associated protein 2 [Paenibacillus sp. OV219]
MRISGLASGMDIDSMVKELMKGRRASLDTLVQKRTVVQWQQEDYREMSTKIVDFRNNKIAGYNLSSAINAKKADVSGNAGALTVNATSSTASGSMDVNVQQVAQVARTMFTFDGNGDGTADSTSGKTLVDLGFDTSLPIFVNGAQIDLDGTDSIKTLVSKINSNKSAKVTAMYNDATGQLSITNSQVGKGSGVNGSDDPDGSVSITGMSALFTEAKTAGKNAVVDVNGITYEQTSNRFAVNGIDFTLKAESGTSGSTTVSVVTDTDKILNTIKSFVADYNSIVDTVNGKIGQERYRSYTPLTDDQREGMTDKQQELWDEKSHSGLLRNDTILSGMLSDLRTASTSSYSGTTSIQSIGITTGSWYDKGKLVIDENKLRSAIEENPEQVVNMFSKSGDDSKPTNQNVGVFAKMTRILSNTLKSLNEKAGTSTTSTDTTFSFLPNSMLSSQITDMQNRESSMADRLADVENQYYKTFSAMEEAMNKYNSQASSLSSFS